MAEQRARVDGIEMRWLELGAGRPAVLIHGIPTSPELQEKVMAADILVLTTPIWLGEKSSVCTQAIERLYGSSAELNEHGQFAYYGRVGGCLVTGNEDGVKHCAMNILYSLQHLGYTIPPQRTRGGSGRRGRAHRTWIPSRAARRTTSRTATPRS